LPLMPNWAPLRWLHPLFGMLNLIGLDMPERMLGFVWDEDGHIVGNATLGLAYEQSDIWLLSNVAVHPNYRRRGIGHALLELALNETRRHGGKYLTLQVQSDNASARRLYKRLGFRTLERICELHNVNPSPFEMATRALRLATPTREQWSAVRSLAAAHLPVRLRTFRHAHVGMFRIAHQRNWLGKFGELSRGIQLSNWCVLDGARVVGGLMVQAQLSWGTHRAAVVAARSAYGNIETLLLAQAQKQVNAFASRRVLFLVPADHAQMIEYLSGYGYRELRTLELMAVEL
ncbi:MAG: GNAT family N-acetyltransferase, partial [Chloroflexi bacterium]|nr:GNAT family N-acetyltransferase [Chloroflexota bacterium]